MLAVECDLVGLSLQEVPLTWWRFISETYCLRVYH